MSKVCRLKIEPRFYDLIVQGVKTLEVRKTDKRYIEPGDIIMFKDLNDDRFLGFSKVIYSQVLIRQAIVDYHALDTETRNFINEHYKNNRNLFVMKIEHLTTYDEMGKGNE